MFVCSTTPATPRWSRGLHRIATDCRSLVRRVGMFGEPVRGVIEAMNGARFVHDHLEQLGWEIEIADAAKVKGLAPLACKTDRIDAWVLAELSRRDLVPAIWLPTPGVRAERERARWRLHLVKRRTAFKNRVHSILIAFGYPKLASDLFGVAGRAQLEALEFPEPWHSNLVAALRLIDELDTDITGCERDLRRLGAEHPLRRVVDDRTRDRLGARLHHRRRDRRHRTVRVREEAHRLHRTLSQGRPVRRVRLAGSARQERTAVSALGAHRSRRPRRATPCYRTHYERTKRRCGKQRGAKIARVEIARKLATAIWHMLTRGEPFAPTSPNHSLTA